MCNTVGQTPLKLARALEAEAVPIIGTSPDAIDLAEDRERFQQLIDQLKLKQPPNRTARSTEASHSLCRTTGLSFSGSSVLRIGWARHGNRLQSR